MKLSSDQQDCIKQYLLLLARTRLQHYVEYRVHICPCKRRFCEAWVAIDEISNTNQKKYLSEMVEAHNILIRMRELMHSKIRRYNPAYPELSQCDSQCPCNDPSAAARINQTGLWQVICSLQEFMADRYQMDYTG